MGIKDDNVFDVAIAAVLGVLAVMNDKAVKLYGWQYAAAMLLPATPAFDGALSDLSP